ncbi:MAG: pyruvate kinase [Prevotellaceae bacterium]|jgi:pyruvate kinase|nr:pyruvate kinase [Prevotellaceae bacterium]
MKHTKIVATISDLRCDVDFICDLYRSGMNVVRMNTAHIDEEGFRRLVSNTRAVSNKIAILVDTKGPEIRTTKTESGENIELHTGDKVKIIGDPNQLSTPDCVAVSYPNIVKDLSVGGDLLFDDGEIDLKVIEKNDDYLLCEVLNDGSLGSRKSVNVPGVRINLPSLTDKDRKNIDLAIQLDVDFIAHSFVRNKQDVLDIQQILDKQDSQIKIIAKIENQEGVDNIDEILEVAYGIMIARGDLGIEVPQEKIPGIQRKLIRKAISAKKPVIVATQMLHSMINNPRPTRAEVTDIANAIYYRTDAIMLSGETAYGKYPVEAVQTMAKVAAEAELSKIPENDIKVRFDYTEPDTTAFLAKQATKAAQQIGTKAIITDSYTGRTARYLAAFRSSNPVLAICYKERTMRELALSYGVFASYQAERADSREYLLDAMSDLRKQGKISDDDYISYLSGSFGAGNGTTFLEINQVKKILHDQKRYRLPSF